VDVKHAQYERCYGGVHITGSCSDAINLTDVWVAQVFSEWQHQLDIDPEKARHRSYELFWIWLSKSWFVSKAIEWDPFHSDVFVWSDIGSFRRKKYNHQKWLQHPEVIPRTALMLMASEVPRLSNSPWIQKGEHQMYVAGAQMAGTVSSWSAFHSAFTKTVQEYLKRNLFVGEDQSVIQSTCIQHPSLCAFVTPDLVRGDVWFGLQDVLYRGGEVFNRGSSLLFWLPNNGIMHRL
jgi:hypothetical protein